MGHATPRAITPSCPRCGYDQSGAVATWTDSCPVTGRCPECGTGFEWADLFDPSRQDITWFVEHAATGRSVAVRSLPTIVRVIVPWIFWRRVGVGAAVRPQRLALWLVCWSVGIHFLASPLVGLLLAGAARTGYPTWGGLMDLRHSTSVGRFGLDMVTGVTWPFYMLPTGGYMVTGEAESAIAYLAPLWIGVSWAFLLCILPTTRRLARLRTGHLLRALFLQAAMVVLIVEVIRVLAAAYEHFWEDRLIGVGMTLTAGAFVWSVVWWSCALRMGWGIRSWLLLVLGFIVAFLSMPIAIGLCMSLLALFG